VRRTKNGRFISLGKAAASFASGPTARASKSFASGTRNHLDVPMDEQDRIFVRDNTMTGDGLEHALHVHRQDGFYATRGRFTRHPKEVLPMIHDFGGGSPCQGWVYCDDGLPGEVPGRIFPLRVGPRQDLGVKVQPDGAGSGTWTNPVRRSDRHRGQGLPALFDPPMADGCGFWITDWAFSGWSQKKVAGRILKVTYVKDDVKPAPRGRRDRRFRN